MYFATADCPEGWVKANGQPVPRAEYPLLFAAIGTAFGDPSPTTFALPDLRGEFIRGVDDGRGIDRGRALGSPQPQDFKTLTVHNCCGPASTTSSDQTVPKTGALSGNIFGGQWATPAGALRFRWDTTSEVRPRNVALLGCIKN